MYLLLAVAIMAYKGKTDSKIFRWIATSVAYFGVVGAAVALLSESHAVYNFEALKDYGNIRYMLSHGTLLLGCLCVFLGGFFKIRVNNIFPFIGVGICAIIIGLIDQGIFSAFGLTTSLTDKNPMYMFGPANGIGIFSIWVMLGIVIPALLLFLIIYEFFAYKKEDRWYKNLHLNEYLPVPPPPPRQLIFLNRVL
jgi:hypothetical protein